MLLPAALLRLATADEDENCESNNICCKDRTLGGDLWLSSTGASCAQYVENQWCTPEGKYGTQWNVPDWGTFEDWANNGVTATEACCQCGGGTVYRKGEPIREPTLSPVFTPGDCNPACNEPIDPCDTVDCVDGECVLTTATCEPAICSDGSEQAVVPGTCCEFLPCGLSITDRQCQSVGDCNSDLNDDADACTSTSCYTVEIGGGETIGFCFDVTPDECSAPKCADGSNRVAIPGKCCEFYPCGYCVTSNDCAETVTELLKPCSTTLCIENTCQEKNFECSQPLWSHGEPDLQSGTCCLYEAPTCERQCVPWYNGGWWALPCADGQVCSENGCCINAPDWNSETLQYNPLPAVDSSSTCVDKIDELEVCPAEAVTMGSTCSCEQLQLSRGCDATVNVQGTLTAVSELCPMTCEVCRVLGRVGNCHDNIEQVCRLHDDLSCSCNDVVNELTCEGIVQLPWGNLAVDALCAKSCNRCTVDDQSSQEHGCRDLLPVEESESLNLPASCPDLLSQESCGEMVFSGGKSHPVNALCPESCGVCSPQEPVLHAPCSGVSGCDGFLDEGRCVTSGGCVWGSQSCDSSGSGDLPPATTAPPSTNEPAVTCPVGENGGECSGRGICALDEILSAARCFCFSDWHGPDCSLTPTDPPTCNPTVPPSTAPPTRGPTANPSRAPTSPPTTVTPSRAPSPGPSPAPSPLPTREPSLSPSVMPTHAFRAVGPLIDLPSGGDNSNAIVEPETPACSIVSKTYTEMSLLVNTLDEARSLAEIVNARLLTELADSGATDFRVHTPTVSVARARIGDRRRTETTEYRVHFVVEGDDEKIVTTLEDEEVQNRILADASASSVNILDMDVGRNNTPTADEDWTLTQIILICALGACSICLLVFIAASWRRKAPGKEGGKKPEKYQSIHAKAPEAVGSDGEEADSVALAIQEGDAAQHFSGEEIREASPKIDSSVKLHESKRAEAPGTGSDYEAFETPKTAADKKNANWAE